MDIVAGTRYREAGCVIVQCIVKEGQFGNRLSLLDVHSECVDVLASLSSLKFNAHLSSYFEVVITLIEFMS